MVVCGECRDGDGISSVLRSRCALVSVMVHGGSFLQMKGSSGARIVCTGAGSASIARSPHSPVLPWKTYQCICE